MNRVTELVPTSSVVVADRLREDFGDISKLAESIREHGLLHPLTVDQDNKLIAGERRLRAMKELGYIEVEVRRWSLLDENERREIELEENIRRKDLSSYERSKNLVELAEVAKEVDRKAPPTFRTDSVQKDRPASPQGSTGTGDVAAKEVTAESVETRAESAQVSKGSRGPAQTPGSLRRVAARIGVPEATIREAQKHVTAAEAYPVLQQPGWKAYQAMEAAEVIAKLPEEDRQPVAHLIDQPGIPPQAAIPILHNLANKDPRERKEIIALAASDDSRDKSLAITKAAELPPMPDERDGMLDAAVRTIRKAIKIHPNDPEVPQLNRIADDLKQVIIDIQERAHDRHTQPAA